MADAFWVLWFAGCLLIAYWLIRAARDYRDDDPQPGPVWDADRQRWRHSIPASPDNMPGVDDTLLAACQDIARPDHDPNHRTTKGD